MEKPHTVFRNHYSERIGFLCRTINLLEDIYEDSECRDLYVSMEQLESNRVVIEPIDCRYEVEESIDVFNKYYDIEEIEVGVGDTSFYSLYEYVIDYYRNTLHYKMLEYSGKTRNSGFEYYMGVLFDGSAFIVEGWSNRVVIPGVKQCLSAHTHPSPYPIPSRIDLRSISRQLVDRGLAHIIVAYSSSLVIYRVKPLTINDLELLKEIEGLDPPEVLRIISKTDSIRIRYI
ncbi:MAG: hypothetical protein B6U89_02445 [Desulfurococcales archaeon ex4484_58]|nr:MAG: hypothetical protein B6U89_02445 [Desulfurococcales archaeon ex4484_58]